MQRLKGEGHLTPAFCLYFFITILTLLISITF